MKRILAVTALVAAFALSAQAASVVVAGETYHVYGLASWEGPTPTTQFVFLDTVAVDSADVEVPFNAADDWSLVDERMKSGHLVLSLTERMLFSTVLDTVTDTGGKWPVQYEVADRDSLTGCAYVAIRQMGSKGVTQTSALSDSLAGTICGGTLSQAAVVARAKLALAEFLAMWQGQGRVIRVSRAEYNQLNP
jgi:hypothetical protein